MATGLEDNFEDILGKAQRGLRLGTGEIAHRAGLDPDSVKALLAGELDEDNLRKVAASLQLDADSLLAIARGEYRPEVAAPDGLAGFTTPFNDMTVNAWLAWDPATRDAAVFDTGADAGDILGLVSKKSLSVRMILLTHTHGDHVFDLDRLISKTKATAYVSHLEPLDGAEPFEPGRTFTIGSLRIETRLTSGHSRGGVTYFIQGLSRPVAIVGDSLFAGSMGGGMISYDDAVRNNREKVLTLPDETVLCPGHGPMTTVADEKRHNPFFA